MEHGSRATLSLLWDTTTAPGPLQVEPAPIFLEVELVGILQILSSQMEQLRKHLFLNIKQCKLNSLSFVSIIKQN